MKRLISKSLVVVICIFFALSSSAYTTIEDVNENDETRHEKILSLYEELLEYNCEKCCNNTQSEFPDFHEREIEKQLFELGVKKLSKEDILKLQNNTNTGGAKVTPPSTTTDIQWYSFTETQTVSGISYSVQHVSAIARTTNTNLSFSNASHALYANKNYAFDLTKKFANIYIQKAVGTIPIINWLPYEFFFVNATSTSAANASYTGMTSAAFSYVKKSGQSDNYQTLSLATNSIRFAGSITATGAANGQPYIRTQDCSTNASSDDFCSTSAAINAYRSNTQKTSYLTSVKMKFAYNSTPQYSCSLQIPTFSIPAQVH